MATFNADQTSPTLASEERASSVSGSDGENDNDTVSGTAGDGNASKKRKRSLKIS